MLAQLFFNACVTGTRMAAPLQALRLGHGETAVGILIALFALSQVFLHYRRAGTASAMG